MRDSARGHDIGKARGLWPRFSSLLFKRGSSPSHLDLLSSKLEEDGIRLEGLILLVHLAREPEKGSGVV